MPPSDGPTTGSPAPSYPNNQHLSNERRLAIMLLLASGPMIVTGLWWFWSWTGGFDMTLSQLYDAWHAEFLRSLASALMAVCGMSLVQVIRSRMSGQLPAPWSLQLRLSLTTGGVLALLLAYDYFSSYGYDPTHRLDTAMHVALILPITVSACLALYSLLTPSTITATHTTAPPASRL